ncbi:hypothetical protein O3M35_007818 [Rhynocoris fuscipes]|uniref:Uncharacterized protein n=1 Tax=Rhynocoris fuscipes TaxID=488301 RepID=A0AAW1DBI8_9HEMI
MEIMNSLLINYNNIMDQVDGLEAFQPMFAPITKVVKECNNNFLLNNLSRLVPLALAFLTGIVYCKLRRHWHEKPKCQDKCHFLIGELINDSIISIVNEMDELAENFGESRDSLTDVLNTDRDPFDACLMTWLLEENLTNSVMSIAEILQPAEFVTPISVH